MSDTPTAGTQQRFGTVDVSPLRANQVGVCDKLVWDDESREFTPCGYSATVRITGPTRLEHYCKAHARDEWLEAIESVTDE